MDSRTGGAESATAAQLDAATTASPHTRTARTIPLGRDLMYPIGFPPDYPFVPLSLSHLSRGSRASRSPSPSKFSASTVMKIARPGHTAIHGAVPRYACAILSMDPHDGVGGCVPSPRNDSVASAVIAPAMSSEACTTIGETLLGRMWRQIMRPSPTPIALAAST